MINGARHNRLRGTQPRKKLDLEIVNCAQSATCLVVLANHGIQLARREHRKKKRNARREFYAIEIGSQ
jgi:hypothetical protein